jgi:hypothetical protein
LKKVHKILPTNRIKGFPDVKFEEERRCLAFVKSFGEVLDIEKVVIDTPFLYEDTLGIGDKGMCGLKHSASTLAMIFAMAWIRLIGLKSETSSAPSFFGKRTTLAELSQWKCST